MPHAYPRRAWRHGGAAGKTRLLIYLAGRERTAGLGTVPYRYAAREGGLPSPAETRGGGAVESLNGAAAGGGLPEIVFAPARPDVRPGHDGRCDLRGPPGVGRRAGAAGVLVGRPAGGRARATSSPGWRSRCGTSRQIMGGVQRAHDRARPGRRAGYLAVAGQRHRVPARRRGQRMSGGFQVVMSDLLDAASTFRTEAETFKAIMPDRRPAVPGRRRRGVRPEPSGRGRDDRHPAPAGRGRDGERLHQAEEGARHYASTEESLTQLCSQISDPDKIS